MAIIFLVFILFGLYAVDAFQLQRHKIRVPLVSEVSNLVGIEGSAVKPNDSIYERLQEVSDEHRAKRKAMLWSIRQLEQYDTDLASDAQEIIDFDVPKTVTQMTANYLSQPAFQFVLSAALATMGLRLSFGQLQLIDFLAGMSAWCFWHVQEWFVHDRLYHGISGNERFPTERRAVAAFQHHDHHHVIPFFHVAAEPLRLCVAWFLVVSAVSYGVFAPVLGLPLATTVLCSYTSCGLLYMSLHYLTHTKVPLPGWLQSVRENHMAHHLDAKTNFSMGVNTMDAVAGTTKPLQKVCSEKANSKNCS